MLGSMVHIFHRAGLTRDYQNRSPVLMSDPHLLVFIFMTIVLYTTLLLCSNLVSYSKSTIDKAERIKEKHDALCIFYKLMFVFPREHIKLFVDIDFFFHVARCKVLYVFIITARVHQYQDFPYYKTILRAEVQNISKPYLIRI